MTVKKIITSGCSFTETRYKDTWPCILKEKFPDIDFDFLGLESSGNEIIQKRASNALFRALETYQPDEILVMVMWSSSDRKTFFLDRTQANNMIDDWKEQRSQYNVCAQFADLDAQFKSPVTIKQTRDNLDIIMRASGSDGWYNLHQSHHNDFEKLFYTRIHNTHAGINNTLENFLLLNMLCERHKVRLVNLFMLDITISDCMLGEHEINKYLSKEFKTHPIIKPSCFNYVKSLNDPSHFRHDGSHPNYEGHKKFVENVVLPWIHNQFPGLLPT